MKNKRILFGFLVMVIAFVFVAGTLYAQSMPLRPGLYKATDTACRYNIESSTRSYARKVQAISANGRHIAWGTAVINGGRADVSFDNIDDESWTILGNFTGFIVNNLTYTRISD